MAQLSEISFLLPETAEGHDFLDRLRSLFAAVPYASTDDRLALTLTPPSPTGARPLTTFRLADVPAPEVAFDTGHSVRTPPFDEADDTRTLTATVELPDLTRRLAGHVRRVDHTGVNLPSRLVSPEQWHDLVGALAAASTMYRYPTGEEWPFLLPSTSAERHDDIRDFVVGREPRFELVHETWLTAPLWQFALWTDLPRTELERLFPEPEGLVFPELAEIFRVVPVVSPWPNLGFRFDLCYRVDDGPTDWETGEWLVTAGGRIH